MAKLFKTTFKLRRGSSEVWDKNNPILAYGEPGFDKDKYTFKIGDGKKHWKELKPIGATVQADWNQNDDTQSDYIKNRLAYVEHSEIKYSDPIVNLNSEDFNTAEAFPGYYLADLGLQNEPFAALEKYEVTIEEQMYNTVATKLEPLTVNGDALSLIALGNMSMLELIDTIPALANQPDTGEPFIIIAIPDVDGYIVSLMYKGYDAPQFVTVRKIEHHETIRKIEPKFYERLAWEEEKLRVLIPLQSVDIEVPAATGANFGMHRLYGFEKKLVVGEKYTVIFDGTKYECICKHKDEATMSPYGMGAIDYIGNESLFMGDTGENTGEPFIVAHDLRSVAGAHGCFAALGTHTVVVYERYEEVHQIEPKFYERLAYGDETIILPERNFNSKLAVGEGEISFVYCADTENIVYIDNTLLHYGQEYNITINGQKYKCIYNNTEFEGFEGFDGFFGNKTLMPLLPSNQSDNTGEEFFIFIQKNGSAGLFTKYAGEYLLSITQGDLKKIEPKYYDRLVCEETVDEVVLPDTAINFDDGAYTGFLHSKTSHLLVNGNTYVVTIDNNSYTVKAKMLTESETGISVTCVGNDMFITGNPLESTLHPFFIAYLPNVESNCVIAAFDHSEYPNYSSMLTGTHTISIVCKKQVIQKIDHKYYDALGWDYVEEVKILPEITVDFSDNGIDGILENAILKEDVCKVVFDGLDYQVTPKIYVVNGVQIIVLGNASLKDDITNAINTGEPFMLAAISENFAYLYAATSGEHTISVTQLQTKTHRIEKKYLPTPDCNELSFSAEGYIANKPCYKGTMVVNMDDLVNAGASMVILGFLPYVRVSEYVPYGDWVNDIEFTYLLDDSTFYMSEYGFSVENDSWQISDIDAPYIIAISDDYIKKEQSKFFQFKESGIYAIKHTMNMVVKLPIIKQLDKSLVTIDWDNLSDIPFGVKKGNVIKLKNPNLTHNCHINKFNVDDNGKEAEQIASYHKVYLQDFRYTDLEKYFGCELLLSDGSVITVTENSFIPRKVMSVDIASYGIAYDLENLLILADCYNVENTDIEFDESYICILDSTSGAIDDHNSGIYTSDSTGVYVTEIRFPDEIKKIPEELLPDSLTSGSSTITDEEVDALIASII